MRVFHWLGLACLGLAVAILIGDVYVSVAGDGVLRFHALGEWWSWIHVDSLLLLQPAIERYVTPALWDPGVQTLLEWPAVAEFAVLGAVFWMLGRLRRRGRSGNGLKFRR